MSFWDCCHSTRVLQCRVFTKPQLRSIAKQGKYLVSHVAHLLSCHQEQQGMEVLLSSSV